MKVAERTRLVFTRSGIPDRVPVHSWLGLPLIRDLKPKEKSMYEMLQRSTVTLSALSAYTAWLSLFLKLLRTTVPPSAPLWK